jgi:Kef-type K+ transport system membrane component KefB
MEVLNPVLVGFTGCLMVSFLLAEFFNTLRYPRVLGYISTGIIFNIPVIKSFMLHPAFHPLIEFLSDVGIVFFLLLAGAEIDVTKLKRMSLPAAAVGLLSFTIPFILGLVFLSSIGFNATSSFILSMCLSVTAAAVAVEILMEYGLLKTNDGSIIVGASMIDDLLGVLALTVILVLIKAEGAVASSILTVFLRMFLEYMAFFLIAYVLGFRIYPFIARFIWREMSDSGILTLSIIFGLMITILSQVFGLSSLIGAFIAGLIINLTVKNKVEGREIVKGLNTLTFGLIIPFFFILIGLKFNLISVLTDFPLLIALVLIAGLGKYSGVFIAGKLTGLNQASINTVGLGMNDRGGIELIIALVAVSNGLISNSMFSIIVSVAFITTFISLFYFKKQIHENLKNLGVLVDGVLTTGGEKHTKLQDIK